MLKLFVRLCLRIDSPESARICELFKKKTVRSRFSHHRCRFCFSHRGDMATPAAVNPSGKSQFWCIIVSIRSAIQINRVQFSI